MSDAKWFPCQGCGQEINGKGFCAECQWNIDNGVPICSENHIEMIKDAEKRGQSDALKEVIEMRVIEHKEDFDLYEDRLMINLYDVLGLLEPNINWQALTADEIEEKLKELEKK